MFTGIIEELGTLRQVERRGAGARVTIAARIVTEGTQEGDSIAVNGVCLTALDVTAQSFAADVSGETWTRTTLGNLRPGTRVNLERAVMPTTRLGGHIVQGHVDARGRLVHAHESNGSWTVRVAYPPEIARYLVFKGSLAVEGISLTIAALTENYCEFAIIPKTWQMTNFAHLKAGDEVNLEADILAKHIERLMQFQPCAATSDNSEGLTLAKLQALGFA